MGSRTTTWLGRRLALVLQIVRYLRLDDGPLQVRALKSAERDGQTQAARLKPEEQYQPPTGAVVAQHGQEGQQAQGHRRAPALPLLVHRRRHLRHSGSSCSFSLLPHSFRRACAVQQGHWRQSGMRRPSSKQSRKGAPTPSLGRCACCARPPGPRLLAAVAPDRGNRHLLAPRQLNEKQHPSQQSGKTSTCVHP